MTPAKRGRALAEAVPGARYEELAGIGHMLPEETPERLAALVLGLVP
jgi:pimeloyl-ACP methyl ester carboxylesterase